jgi:hypothetical protein
VYALCFWATQTAVAALDLFVWPGRSKFTPYLPLHSAATVIQQAYMLFVSIKYPVRALLAHINASIACSDACSKAYQAAFDAWLVHIDAEFDARLACLNANLAKSNATMACLSTNLGEHVGCSGRPGS